MPVTEGRFGAPEPTLEDLAEAFKEELTRVAQAGLSSLEGSLPVPADLRTKIETQVAESVSKTADAYAQALHPFLRDYLDSKFSTLSESIHQVLSAQVSAVSLPQVVGPGTSETVATSVTQSITNTLVTASTQTVNLTTTPADLVLWRWNGTDISQFDTTPITSSGVTATISYLDPAPGAVGGSIVISASWSGTTDGAAAFRVADSENLTLPEKFIMYFRLSRTRRNNSNGETVAVGPFYHNGDWDGGLIYGFGTTISGDAILDVIRCEGSGAVAAFSPFEFGALGAAGPTWYLHYPGTNMDMFTCVHEGFIKQPASATVSPLMMLNFNFMSSVGSSAHATQINWFTNQVLWGSGESEPAAKWRGRTCDKFAIAARRKNQFVAGGSPGVMQISDLIITKHPDDW